MDFLLTTHKDNSLREVPLQPKALTVISSRLTEMAKSLLDDSIARVKYEPGYKPDDEEVFELKFELPSHLSKVARSLPNDIEIMDSKTLNQNPPTALVAVTTGKKPQWLFQAVGPSRTLRQERALFVGQDTFVLNKHPGILLPSKVHAVYQDGKLYFQSEQTVRRFLDLSSTFEAATDTKIEEFFGRDIFAVQSMDAIKANAKTPQRRKISQLMALVEDFDIPALKKAAKRTKIKMETDAQDRIVIPADNKDFRSILDLLNDEYLQSLHGATIYKTNSKRRVDAA